MARQLRAARDTIAMDLRDSRLEQPPQPHPSPDQILHRNAVAHYPRSGTALLVDPKVVAGAERASRSADYHYAELGILLEGVHRHVEFSQQFRRHGVHPLRAIQG